MAQGFGPRPLSVMKGSPGKASSKELRAAAERLKRLGELGTASVEPQGK